MALLIPITDRDDPRLSPFKHVRERDLTGRQQGLMAEGEVVVRTLLSPRSRATPQALLLSERAFRALADALETAPADLPVYLVSQPVMDAIAGFPIHRGILALARRPASPSAADLLRELPERALVLALVGIANHDNVGGLFRNAAAFGAGAVLLDGTSCDPLYRKAIRVSVGASLTVPFARGGTANELLAALAGNGFETLALSPSGAEGVERVARRARTALVVGSEGPGLPADILARSRAVRIAMAPGFDSLNVATAAAIALHRLAEMGDAG